MTVKRPMPERFWEKVNKTDTCWLWTGSTSNGYGKFSINNRPTWAHRVAYELEVGPIPTGMQLDHACRERNCVNPEHLRAVTKKQNQEHTDGKALPSNKTSGIRGVFWNSQKQCWHAKVEHNRRVHHVGYFSDLTVAAEAVRAMRNQLFTHNDADRKVPA